MNKTDGLVDQYPLGERIRYFRKKRGLTQSILASRCKITQGALAQIEKSQVLPSLQTLRLISSELKVHIAVLFAGDDVFVLDVKMLSTKYRKKSDLTPALKRALEKVADYAKSITHY
jgi:transcriptional regulator with XRE-family HTH domain